MRQPLLQIDISAGYHKQTSLSGFHLQLEPGERLGLVGSSGAGKSTLVLALMGLLPWCRGWVKGSILFEGTDLLRLKEKELRKLRGRRIALVPQSPMSALNSALSLGAHFEEAWRAHEDPRSPRFVSRLNELLAQVQLPSDASFLRRKPSQISVGQAQRVVIALALLHRPALLIADEPTSALDPAIQREVQRLLLEANDRDGSALLYVSHDLISVLQVCERMAVLDRGAIVESVSCEGIDELARHSVTRALLQTLPVPPALITAYASSNRTLEAAPATVEAGSRNA